MITQAEVKQLIDHFRNQKSETESVEFKEGKREDFEKILLDKLPDVLDISQKQNKIKNNLQSLKRQGLIEPRGKVWTMSKLDT